ncbi:hypothetical protein BLOT_010468 [Blomia tropicalis]|nr:hypothetical protein BLOT_010468 [Blomia tropicalis]
MIIGKYPLPLTGKNVKKNQRLTTLVPRYRSKQLKQKYGFVLANDDVDFVILRRLDHIFKKEEEIGKICDERIKEKKY